LDSFGNPEIFGKAIGGDILNDKKTWLLISALEQDSTGKLRQLMGSTDTPAEKIAQVRAIYTSLSLDEKCHDLVKHYADKAMTNLKKIAMSDDAREFFTQIVNQSATRTH
ncbi:MAG: polyprenyl synthetase family protein, partial [Muribaculaceae bacterium]|nr:polyprenyl synthetase family protein [Muribaculaceae bacterium]